MSIRPYQPADQAALLEVWYRSATVAHHFLRAEHFEQERQDIASQYLPVAETWVYEHQGQVVGFISLLGQTVGGFFVHPSMQGKGVGWALMDHALQLKGALDVEVFARNEIGRRFYNRYGFVETGRSTHTDTNETLIRMELPDSGLAASL
jgi:putative acetyltransferase